MRFCHPTGMSGVSHLRLGNVHKKLFLSLLLPGIVSALVGVFILGEVDGSVLKPFISAYLLVMGVYVFAKAFRRVGVQRTVQPRRVAPLAFVGGADCLHQRVQPVPGVGQLSGWLAAAYRPNPRHAPQSRASRWAWVPSC